ncbi:L-lactate permease [Actinotalea fermentans]|uniref:L-lactate permease n=1 Tax=Actinotalea fermentans TaxID=43671 RepID=A0A511YXK2_9CELL|nr:L-lactate permease [Actinotalea fermentans]KGM16812.1 lactate transporter [Actinotalea fermentans ATCC 43279 = JCM 9966 = DSM 3133]GEN79928.1 L-lactate permease [Actinotalea fermentans]
MFVQDVDPVADSLLVSALCAAVPLLLLFVLLGVVRMKAHRAALVSLAAALVLAVVGWGMPAGQALSAAAEGGFYGLFPILWILVNALWLYRVTVDTPWFDVLGRSIRSVSDDLRILAILVAFCFGSLLEALAGYGAPVAISAAMLMAAGMKPMTSALVSLLANTAPVAFGAMAAPIIALAGVTGLPLDDLSAMAGRQTPFIALLVPLLLVLMVDGRRGVRQTWPVALVAGLVFGLAKFVTANYLAVELTDVVAAVATVVAVLAMLRVWRPAEVVGVAREGEAAPAAVERPAARQMWFAVAPYLVIMAIFSVAQVPAVKAWLSDVGRVTFGWPGLDVVTPEGEPVGAQTFTLDHLKATGTLLLLAGIATMAMYRVGPRRGLRIYRETLGQLRLTIVTVTAVLALSFVMNLSGQTTTLGAALASTGAAFAALSPLIGWIGVALTGSDTSSNALFGQLQVTAAQETGLSPVLMASANSSAGVLGKMLSLQNLAVAAAAVGQPGSEPTLFRTLLPWSIGLLVLVTGLVLLQTGPLAWMVP